MSPSAYLKITMALVLLLTATLLTVQFFRQNAGPSEVTFFYDQSEQKLFTGPRHAVPPIRGINDAAEDAVRAVVISTNGHPRDKKSWQIAYLETCTPELKRQMEAAQASGSSPEMGRGLAQAHRLVRRLSETNWYPMVSPEAEQIMSAWLTAGPGGEPATICTP